MRHEPLPDISEGDPAVGYADWKERPTTVLEAVDRLLDPFGLEVVEFDTGGDWHEFRIEKRKVGDK